MDPVFWISIALAWLFLPVLVLFLPLLRLRFQRFERLPARFEDVPPHVLAIVLPEGTELVAQGFELVGPLIVREFDVSQPDTRAGYHLVHRELGVHAYLRAGSPDRARPVMLVLESYLGDAETPTLLATLDVRHTEPLFADARCVTHYIPWSGVAAALDAHLTRRSTMGLALLAPTDEQALVWSSSAWNAWLERAVRERRWLATPEAGHHRMESFAALRYALWFRFDSVGRRRRAEQLRVSRAEEPAPVEEEVATLQRIDELLGRPIARRQSATFFVLGTVIFALWFGSDDWVFGLVLSGVVLFHELGHALAMRVVGYRDVRVYFVPFMGGATSGIKRDASIHQEIAVLLAGPVPGIVVGLALAGLRARDVVPSSTALDETIAMLLAVNYLNLLPVFPLDGGRVAHRLVAGRIPALELLVRVGAIAVLGVAALAGLGSLLGFLAVVLVIGTRSAWRVARAEQLLRRGGVDRLPTQQRLRAIFDSLVGTRGWTLRLGLARQLQLRLDAPDASWPARIAWGVVYVVLFTAPLGLALALWMSGTFARRHEHDALDVEGQVSCTPGPPRIDPSATVLVCAAEPPHIEALLREIARRYYCIPPPWRDAPTIDQQRARATLTELHDLALATFIADRASGVGLEDHETHMLEVCRAHIEQRRADQDFDAAAADIWLQHRSAGRDEMGPDIVARVGGTTPCDTAWIVDVDEDRIAIAERRDDTFVPLDDEAARWLCEQGCGRIGWNHWTARSEGAAPSE